MNPVPELSVVMSVYNNEASLPAALESILSQEDVVLEFIVIDDGSTDGSGKILEEAAARDSRLKVVHQQNEGLTCALIKGCALASAPWIARQDADDVSFSGRLRAQLDRAQEADGPVLVGCGARVVAPENEVLSELISPVDPAAAKRRILEEGQAISPHGSILFQRNAYQHVGGYRIPFYYAQDIDLTTRLAECEPVAAVQPIYYEYRISPSAISGMYGAFQQAFYQLIREGHLRRLNGESEDGLLKMAEALREECLRARRRRPDSFETWYYIGACLMPSNPEAASRYFSKALACRPWSLKAQIRRMQSEIRKRGRTA